MIDVCRRKTPSSNPLPKLAWWPVIGCLMMSGCASKTPEAANEPSSYPPWVCGLSHNKDRWQCQREGEEPAPSPPAAEPAPSGDDSPPPAAADTAPEPADEASAPAWQAPSAAAPQSNAATGSADQKSKLMALPPDYFAIQAGAFSSAEALHQHTVQYGIEPAYRVRLAGGGRPFHALILQVYDSRAAAEAAVADLPQPLNDMDLWIRSIGSVQDAVRAADALANEAPSR